LYNDKTLIVIYVVDNASCENHQHCKQSNASGFSFPVFIFSSRLILQFEIHTQRKKQHIELWSEARTGREPE
jgi:hypothetical protein